MEFQITMDPFMDFIFRMFIIGANVVVWTIIGAWLIKEVSSWFNKEEEEFFDENEMIEQETPLFDQNTPMAHYTVSKDGELFQNFDMEAIAQKAAMRKYLDCDLEATAALFDQNAPTAEEKILRNFDVEQTTRWIVQWSKLSDFSEDVESVLSGAYWNAIDRLVKKHGSGFIRHKISSDDSDNWTDLGYRMRQLEEKEVSVD